MINTVYTVYFAFDEFSMMTSIRNHHDFMQQITRDILTTMHGDLHIYNEFVRDAVQTMKVDV